AGRGNRDLAPRRAVPGAQVGDDVPEGLSLGIGDDRMAGRSDRDGGGIGAAWRHEVDPVSRVRAAEADPGRAVPGLQIGAVRLAAEIAAPRDKGRSGPV